MNQFEEVIKIDKYSLEELPKVAIELERVLPDYGVIAVHGEMGVGKTTLIRELCKVWGVEDEVTSPTYGLVHVYKCLGHEKVINHIDLYRLKGEAEAEAAGIIDLLHSNNISFVEWPERIVNALPEDFWMLKIELAEKNRHYGKRKLILLHLKHD